MKNLSIILFAFVLLNAFTSCRSTKKLQKAVAKKDTTVTHVMNDKVEVSAPDNSKTTLASMAKNHIDFQTFSAKIKVQYEDTKGKMPTVNAIIRMKKDSVIWITINAQLFNIEAYRILITREKITIINKLGKEFEEHPFSYVEDIAKIPLDFKILQDLLMGNPIYVGDKILSYKLTENHILLSTIGQYFKNLLTLSVENNNLVERSKLDDINVNLNRTADLTYGEYENKAGFYFSTYREITVAEKTKVDIQLYYKQYDFNTELSYPFTIPKNYKRK